MLIKNLDRKLVNGSTGIVVRFKEDNTAFPVVKFDNGSELTIVPELWESDGRRLQLSRTQLPLILAWAVTIHKCQGQTIRYASVNLDNAFAQGQGYVALSRVQSLDGLQVTNFHPEKCKRNTVVDEFYRTLSQ